MKVRVRLSRVRTEVVQVESEACLLRDLKKLVEEKGALSRDFELSLNQKDALVGSEKSMDELGVVSGDLLYVLYNPAEKEDGGVATASNGVVDKLANEADATACSSTEVTMHTSAEPDSLPRLHAQPFSHLVLGSHLHELQAELSSSADSLSPSHVVTRALHAIMKDCGMMDSGGDALTECNRKHLYVALLEGCLLEVTLVTHQMGPSGVVVHVGAKMDAFEKSYTTQFSTSTYSNCPSPEQLRQLSRVFKDSAINRMFNDCRKVLGLPESGTFSSLLPELKLRVMHLLDVRSLMRLASVSRDLYSLAQDELVWKHLLRRDFGKAFIQCQKTRSWKKAYVDVYTAKVKKGSSLMPEGLLPLRPPVWPPEMIGGDSDLYPHLAPPVFPRGPAHGGALLPLPPPRLVPTSFIGPSHPLLVSRPKTGHHTPPLLPFPGPVSTPPAMYSSHPRLPANLAQSRPPLLPQPHAGRSSLSQPLYNFSLHRHGAGLF